MGTEEVELRFFEPKLLDDVISINLASLPEHYSRDFYLELYRKYPKTFIVAEVGGKMVGYVMCRIERSPFSIGYTKVGHVVSIAVLADYRRRGIGSSLLKKALEGMLEYNAKECYLEVRISNEPAIKMYEKLGFRVTSRIRHYYLDGEDAYIMTKKLIEEVRKAD